MASFALSHFSAGYGPRTVLHGVTCRMLANQTTAIMGPGGSGKTTMLRALAGTLGRHSSESWSTGRIVKPSCQLTVMKQRCRRSKPTLAHLLSLEDLDESSARLSNFWSGMANAPARLLISHLHEKIASLPNELLRLADFTATAAAPTGALLLDEPTAGLDTTYRAWIAEKLIQLHGQKTIILVSHNLRLIQETSQRAILLVAGRVIETGSTRSLFSSPRLRRTRQFVTFGS